MGAQLASVMAEMDAAFPGHIAGVHLSGLHTGEWFFWDDDDPALFHDYSASASAEFCALYPTLCPLPAAVARARPTVGTALLDNSTVAGAASVQMSLFLSQLAVRAITGLAAAIKSVSGGNALVMTFYGYLFELGGRRLPGSGHLALQTLLASPYVDMIVSPYSYSVSRQPGFSLVPSTIEQNIKLMTTKKTGALLVSFFLTLLSLFFYFFFLLERAIV
jgi:hypothetical protein